jgi:hypothetical protein
LGVIKIIIIPDDEVLLANPGLDYIAAYRKVGSTITNFSMKSSQDLD